MADPDRPARGIIGTSVIIDLEQLDQSLLPVEQAISAITLAELSAGPHATSDPEGQYRRAVGPEGAVPC